MLLRPRSQHGEIAPAKRPAPGGTISYSYSGGSNGITCADGSVATLTRYTPDTGTAYWTYAHTESGTAWSTKVTDPQGNQSVMNFQGIYPTETQVYQGTTSGTLLQTTYTCYNGSSAPCNSTAVTQPITQVSAYTLWPGGLESEINTDYDKETSNGTTTSYGLVTEKDEYAYGSGAPGSLVRKTLTSYATLTNNIDLTGAFCTSRREREFTRRTAGYANQEVQSRTDRDDTASDRS
ncbi:MAG: hypothetical protein WBF07_18230, partial [Xanthobacteraceae bacterium]